jgi:hypothetical protein
MDDKLKATITQKLAGLEDEQAKQLLDYIEFLDSKYNRSTRDRSPFEKLADNVEGTLRATKIGGAAIKGTTQVLEAATSVVRSVAEAGMAVVDELQRLDHEPTKEADAIAADAMPEEQQEAVPKGEAVPDDAPPEQSGRVDAEVPEVPDKAD